ncbi:MAG: Bax inhibitor-1 family protein [Alicyclobacillaceae bacterium]|nr:Bax inhibitor-1 family protein [Alicyclobacillaceae bacterium]
MRTETWILPRVLGRVFLGLCLSLVTALAGLYAGQYIPPVGARLLMLVELAMLVMALWLQRRRSIGMPFVLLFTFVSGATLFPVIAYYATLLGAATVMKAVAVSAGAFLVAGFVASRSSYDFSFLGGFLLVGLVAVFLMGLVAWFVGFSSTSELVYAWLGVAVFTGYVLFDVNRLARQGVSEDQVAWVVLSLYLDFVNLLLFVLRLFGVMQSSRR